MENKYTIGVFIDLSKAFDNVNRKVLRKNRRCMVLKIEIYNVVKTNCPTKNNTQDTTKKNPILRYRTQSF